MADQLVTIAQVKARLFPNGVADTNDDTMLTEMVEQVSSWVQNRTGRKLLAENATTYVFDTHYGTVLRIPRGIRTITSIGVATTDQPDSGGSFTTVTVARTLLRPKVGDLPEGWPPTEVHLMATAEQPRFWDVRNGCTITGNFGFALTPPDVQGVVITAVVAAYQARKNAGTSQGIDAVTIPSVAAILAGAADVWARYSWYSV